MIVVLLNYKVPIERIDALRPAHLDWLKAGIDAGTLLAAGRKMPVTGGMLIVRGTLDAARQWCATDPFAIEDVAEYAFVEIAPSMAAPGLEALLR
jgi:uncharacterized protein YciI